MVNVLNLLAFLSDWPTCASDSELQPLKCSMLSIVLNVRVRVWESEESECYPTLCWELGLCSLIVTFAVFWGKIWWNWRLLTCDLRCDLLLHLQQNYEQCKGFDNTLNNSYRLNSAAGLRELSRTQFSRCNFRGWKEIRGQGIANHQVLLWRRWILQVEMPVKCNCWIVTSQIIDILRYSKPADTNRNFDSDIAACRNIIE